MNFRLSLEAEALRERLRQELPSILPPELEDDGPGWIYESNIDGVKQFSKDLARRGWLIPSWPKEWGGSEMPLDQQVVLSEELAYRGAPMRINTNRVGYTGPTLMTVGTPEQQRAHLPGIAAGEVCWAQGFSEPGAGSDLAALKTRGEKVEGGYIINGQKIWTSFAHVSAWMILLARTDQDAPKHRGITFFILPTNSPGLTVRPLISPGNTHHFNEVFFEDVFVPRENIVGEENRGWYVGAATLDFERSSVAGSGRTRRNLGKLGQTLKEYGELDERNLLALADFAVAVQVGRLLCYRVMTIQMKGGLPNAEASEAKLFNSELHQRIAYAAPAMLGLRGQLFGPETLAGRVGGDYIQGISGTIGGGTSEIQRNILATRGLGLPR